MPSYILLFWVPQYWYFCTCPILPSHFFLDTASLIFCKFPRCDQKEYSASNSSNTIIYALLCTLLIFTSFPPLNSTLCLPLSIQSLSLSIQQIETYYLVCPFISTVPPLWLMRTYSLFLSLFCPVLSQCVWLCTIDQDASKEATTSEGTFFLLSCWHQHSFLAVLSSLGV